MTTAQASTQVHIGTYLALSRPKDVSVQLALLLIVPGEQSALDEINWITSWKLYQ